MWHNSRSSRSRSRSPHQHRSRNHRKSKSSPILEKRKKSTETKDKGALDSRGQLDLRTILHSRSKKYDNNEKIQDFPESLPQKNFRGDSLREMESELSIIREENDKYSRKICQYEKEIKLDKLRKNIEHEMYSRAKNDLISKNQKMRDDYEIKLGTMLSKYEIIEEKLSEQTNENLRLKEINKNWHLEQAHMVKMHETQLAIYARAKNDLIYENQKMREDYEIKLGTMLSKYEIIEEKLSGQTNENLRLIEINKNWHIEQANMIKMHETQLAGKL